MKAKATNSVQAGAEWPETFLQVKLTVVCTFTEELLGSASAQKDVYAEFIASKAPDAPSMEQEIASLGVNAVAEKGVTVFSRTAAGQPQLWNYQVKGFFKDACGSLGRLDWSKSSKLRAYRKIIDGHVFVSPRQIILELPAVGEVTRCVRPLRAQTAQGERVALAASEAIPAQSRCSFTVGLLDAKLEPALMEWLEYASIRGMGPWRNSGKGTFICEVQERWARPKKGKEDSEKE